MATKRQIKGLELIFDENSVEAKDRITHLEISMITPKKNQPRKYFDHEALAELSSSIAEHGLIQPILVRDLKDGCYEIIAGERRWRASKQAGLSEIPCIVTDADELKAAELALIENIQREDLNSYEEAKAYKSLMEDFNLSQEEVSKKVGKSRPAIANAMRLLELPKEITDMLVQGKLSAGHCKALLGLRNKELLESLAERVVRRNLSVRETETTVRKLNKEYESEKDDDTYPTAIKVDYYEELERKATKLSGRKIAIVNSKKKCAVQIEYTSIDDLENILSKICGQSIIENE